MGSRAGQIIRTGGVLHGFDLRPQARVASHDDKRQARLPLEGSAAAPGAAGGRPVSGGRREFPDLFTCSPLHVGEIMAPGLGRQTDARR
jgi:hypothetical protein